MADDYVMATDPSWPGGGEYRGPGDQRRFLEQFLEPWEELRYERTQEPVTRGSCVVERGRWAGRGRVSGLAGQLDFTVVISIRDRLVTRSDFFIRHEDALALLAARASAD